MAGEGNEAEDVLRWPPGSTLPALSSSALESFSTRERPSTPERFSTMERSRHPHPSLCGSLPWTSHVQSSRLEQTFPALPGPAPGTPSSITSGHAPNPAWEFPTP